MDKKQRRDRIDIYAEILEILRNKGSQKLTPISNRANLNYTRCGEHLSFLAEINLVEDNNGDYSITEKGREFLDHYAIIQECLGEKEKQIGGEKN